MGSKDTILIKTSWDEVNLDEFIQISNIDHDKELRNSNLLRSIKQIAVLSNKTEKELLTYSNEMFAPLLQKIGFIFNETPKDLSKKPFDVNGVKYMFVEEFNNLSTGEMVSVEQLLLDSAENSKPFLADLLPILIRPAIKYKNEFGKMAYKIEEFDADKLKDRKALFLRKLYVPYFVNRITAFIVGTDQPEEISSLYSVRINQLKKELIKLLDR